jgi:sterol desaturase/sphingolipid hydroxylase (fatty acid hydroxylase superfamily)
MDKNMVVFFLSLFLLFSLEEVLPHFKGRKKRLAHALPNFFCAAMHSGLNVALFSGGILWGMEWARLHSFGFFHVWRPPFFIEGFFAFLFLDLWMYCWHRANHEINFLWRFHRMHHTDTDMDVTTALRFHPGEITLSFLANLVIFSSLGIHVWHLALYKAVFNFNVMFHHSNIGLPERIDKILRIGIVTPNMHRVHHSFLRPETDSNYSSVFSFWDRVLKTFKKRDDTLTITFGMKGMQGQKWTSFLGMIATPFRRI